MDCDYKQVWQRNIDKIEFYEGRMKITCTDDTIYIGKSIGSCLGTDAKGEDVDGVRFRTDDGYGVDLIENDIKEIEFLD